jgi:hypothetical protein
MNENSETINGEPSEIARRVLVSASHFAAAALTKFNASYPQEFELLELSGGNFAVKISEILSTNPRVSLVNIVDNKEFEVAHVLLTRPKSHDARTLN